MLLILVLDGLYKIKIEKIRCVFLMILKCRINVFGFVFGFVCVYICKVLLKIFLILICLLAKGTKMISG